MFWLNLLIQSDTAPSFLEKIDLIINNYGFTYDDCIAGVESTGYYWFDFRDYLKDIVIETVMIKTDSVKHRRAL